MGFACEVEALCLLSFKKPDLERKNVNAVDVMHPDMDREKTIVVLDVAVFDVF